jgi:uncharacterized membrane protein YdfJ with MMPL/SSD domain
MEQRNGGRKLQLHRLGDKHIWSAFLETLSRNIHFVLVDATTGFVISRHSVPARHFPPKPTATQIIVVPADRQLPAGEARIDLRKVCEPINHVASIESVQTSWRPKALPDADQFERHISAALGDLDNRFARLIDSVSGPLAGLHAEKRRQAEAGGGPLVDGEDDRLAILANSAIQIETLASLERKRRAIKAAIRAAGTDEEIKAALKPQDEKEAFL